MDFKADRIMDYAVYALSDVDKEFKRVLHIPMMSVSKNGTACSSWIVRSCLCVVEPQNTQTVADLKIWIPIPCPPRASLAVAVA